MDDKGRRSSREGDPSTTTSSSSPIHHSEMPTLADGQLLPAEDKKVVLKDFVLECSPDAAYLALGTLTLTIVGLSEERDTGHMEKVLPTTWKYDRVIQLQSGMDELTFTAQSDNVGDLGYVVLTQDELVAFMAVDQEIKLERNFVMLEENSPSLTITFAIGTSHNDTPDLAFENPALLHGVGKRFSQRFAETNSEDDINRAVSAYELAVQLTSADDANYAVYVRDAGLAFLRRSTLTGKIPDMNRAISITEVAIAYTPENDVNFPFLLSNLGDSFSTRFEHAGDLADIESAISSQQRAVQLTPEGYADLPSRLSNLGNSFSIRFERTGDLADIESAISSQQRAVQVTPEGHAELPSQLNNLGISFKTRFERTGDLADIESAISGQQRAVQLTPEGYADLPSWLSNLGLFFRSRFEHTGDLADIESAISSQQSAVQLTPDGHAYLPFRCNNLGNSFLTRFKCTGDLADIESAISSQQRAIQLTPEGRANLPNQLSNLGTSFSIRFKHTGDLADIESAISSQQRAIQLAPEGHAELPFWLNNLGVSFKTRFKHTGDLADIESAILSQQRAVQLTPEEHVYLPPLLNNLGSFFETRFEHTKNPEDISHVISMYRLSAMQIFGHPSRRLTAARKWATLSRQFDQSASLNAFRVAIGLLSQVAGLEQTIHKRHMNLIDISDLTTSAAAAAFSNGEIKTAQSALAWLEQGRCLVWTQINQLRTPVDNLRAHDLSLADDFLNVAKALEASGSRQEQSSPFSVENMTQMIALQDESHTHVQLAKKWNELLSKIRCIPGFHDFLQPPETSNLLERLKCLALDGPVIIFNIHEERCDALALISGADTPLHIPLESFSHKQAVQLHDHFGKYLNNHHVRMREVDRSMKLWLPETGNVIYEVLRDLWLHVAKPILDALGYSHPSINRSRIWWCPTGPLTFLPIHAAGIYSKDKISSGPCVSDFVISSYTPSVSALLDKIKEAPTKDETSSSLLLISQPNTPGQSRIPATRQETHAIQDMMTVKGIKSLLLEDGAATAIRVKEEMTSHSWVHFACHAIQDAQEPLKSGVRLHDGRLELLEMMRQRIQNADHAFLSACQTSTGDEKLSDEAVHLAAGMLAAGYRGVVATMWSIKDQYGPEVAREFYTQILENTSGEVGKKQLDGDGAARALDHSIQKIRKRLGDTEAALLTWVPYVHFGI